MKMKVDNNSLLSLPLAPKKLRLAQYLYKYKQVATLSYRVTWQRNNNLAKI